MFEQFPSSLGQMYRKHDFRPSFSSEISLPPGRRENVHPFHPAFQPVSHLWNVFSFSFTVSYFIILCEIFKGHEMRVPPHFYSSCSPVTWDTVGLNTNSHQKHEETFKIVYCLCPVGRTWLKCSKVSLELWTFCTAQGGLQGSCSWQPLPGDPGMVRASPDKQEWPRIQLIFPVSLLLYAQKAMQGFVSQNICSIVFFSW